MHRVHLASDLHLGAPDAAHSRERELRFIGWLEDSAAGHNHAQEGPATEIHLVGDIFDFWHEYKHAVPKGGTRLLGAIARVIDSGIPVHYHTGNHATRLPPLSTTLQSGRLVSVSRLSRLRRFAVNLHERSRNGARMSGGSRSWGLNSGRLQRQKRVNDHVLTVRSCKRQRLPA